MSTTPSVDVTAVADAVASVPAVSRLYGGVLSEIATYGPGKRVLGIKVVDREGGARELEVHIVVAPGYTPLQAADAVHGAVAPVAQGLEVVVYVDDVDLTGSLAARPALPSGSEDVASALPPETTDAIG